jgi:hypothetical protein
VTRAAITRSPHRLPAGLTALLAGFATLVGAADLKPRMSIDTGLWEVTTTAQSAGTPALPDSVLQHLTPEQKERLAHRMQQPHRYRQCMTAEKLASGFGGGHDNPGECTTTVTKNTPTEFAAERKCSTPGGKNVDVKLHFRLTGRRQSSGTVELSFTRPDGSVTDARSTIEAKWLAADCGNVKDIERETD